MAYCNSCGANLDGGVRFCPKCGASQPLAATAPAKTVPVSSSSPQSSNTLKVVLIVIAAVVVLGAIAIGTLTFIGVRIARHTHVIQNGNSVQVQTPFGTVNTNTANVTRDLGVDVYPGARILKSNAANVQAAGVHTVAAQFESDDPASKVADFYKAKFPDANVNVSSQDHYTIVSTNKKNLITINIEPQNGKTLISVASVGGKDITGDSSD
jgi:flagellar basal body-associated protein FliL